MTAEDIEAAIAWRLDGVDDRERGAIAQLLRPLAGDFREDRPEVADVLGDLRRPGDRRSAWSLACAVLAMDARRRGDVATFWAAGLETVTAWQQGQRGGHGNRANALPNDQLDGLIAAYRVNHQHAGAAEIFDHFAAIAGRTHEVLIEFDEKKDEIVCQLDPAGDALTNVGRAEFERRVRRVRQAVP